MGWNEADVDTARFAIGRDVKESRTLAGEFCESLLSRAVIGRRIREDEFRIDDLRLSLTIVESTERCRPAKPPSAVEFVPRSVVISITNDGSSQRADLALIWDPPFVQQSRSGT